MSRASAAASATGEGSRRRERISISRIPRSRARDARFPSATPGRPQTSTVSNLSRGRPALSAMALIDGPPIFKRVMIRRILAGRGFTRPPRRR